MSFKPSEWRKIAFGDGKGGMKKPDVAAALIQLYPGIVFETEDHSDALGVAVAGAKYLRST